MSLKNLESINFVNLTDDEASKVVGGELSCNEEDKTEILAELEASGLINTDQVAELSAIPLADFCMDADEVFGAKFGMSLITDPKEPIM